MFLVFFLAFFFWNVLIYFFLFLEYQFFHIFFISITNKYFILFADLFLNFKFSLITWIYLMLRFFRFFRFYCHDFFLFWHFCDFTFGYVLNVLNNWILLKFFVVILNLINCWLIKCFVFILISWMFWIFCSFSFSKFQIAIYFSWIIVFFLILRFCDFFNLFLLLWLQCKKDSKVKSQCTESKHTTATCTAVSLPSVTNFICLGVCSRCGDTLR